MEMVGIICLIGVIIIQMVRQFVEQIGWLLELDIDGIWCMLFGVFFEDFSFKFKNGKKFGILYFCIMFNYFVYVQFINDQYYEFVNNDFGMYNVKKENLIFFELDGFYKVMIFLFLKEEDKLFKKRYVVFNFDGFFVELKGFEVKC